MNLIGKERIKFDKILQTAFRKFLGNTRQFTHTADDAGLVLVQGFHFLFSCQCLFKNPVFQNQLDVFGCQAELESKATFHLFEIGIQGVGIAEYGAHVFMCGNQNPDFSLTLTCRLFHQCL